MSVEEEERAKERTKVSVNNGQVNAWTNNGQLCFQTSPRVAHASRLDQHFKVLNFPIDQDD